MPWRWRIGTCRGGLTGTPEPPLRGTIGAHADLDHSNTVSGHWIDPRSKASQTRRECLKLSIFYSISSRMYWISRLAWPRKINVFLGKKCSEEK